MKELERLKKRVEELDKWSMVIAFIDILSNGCKLTYSTGGVETELFFNDVETAEQYCRNLPRVKNMVIIIDDIEQEEGSG